MPAQSSGRYTRSQVIWLLSLTREDAIEHDIRFRDSSAGLAASDEGGTSPSADGPDLPTIAKWHDVQRARRTVVENKQGIAVLQLRAQGHSEREVAELLGRPEARLALRRRWHATVDDILIALGGSDDDTVVMARPTMCLSCGAHPRVRLAATGTGEGRDASRLASSCQHCLSPELTARISSPIVVKIASAA